MPGATLFLILGAVIGVVGLITLLYYSRVVTFISNSKVGIPERLWSFSGSVQSGLIALGKEAGYTPEVLRGGFHFFFPFQYSVHIEPLVTISQGKIGYIFARDGKPLPATQTLASNVKANNFQDARHFLTNGGQRGPQRDILREGTYAINLAQFVVLTSDGVFGIQLEKGESALFESMRKTIAEREGFTPVVIKGKDDNIGVVTVHDGPSLPTGQIIAPMVGDDPKEGTKYHNKFQDVEAWLQAGGMRGRQLQVLVEGTYYINRLFATVEVIPKTTIEVGSVGVVVSYTGTTGTDVSGEEYRHGELVEEGQKGVWRTPMLPGKYPFNTYAGKLAAVPTTNFILKWNKSEVGSHHFDENLAEVSLITKDAFEPSLPLSVVVHIDYRKAPLVVQRFGDIKRLVEQTLDPMVSAYFKNVAQTRTLIQLLQDRSAIQEQASQEMKSKFAHYNLELEEVLIGTPSSGKSGAQIEQILTQLRERQVAVEQVETYDRQEKAAERERGLREAQARSQQQTKMTEAELSIQIQQSEGKASVARAQQEREKIETLANAEANKIKTLAEAEAERVARVGIAQAMAIEEQVKAYGGPRFQVTKEVMNRFAEAIEAAKVDVVPRILIGGSQQKGDGSATASNGSVLEALLGILLADKMGVDVGSTGESSAESKAMKEVIRAQMTRTAKAGAVGNGM